MEEVRAFSDAGWLWSAYPFLLLAGTIAVKLVLVVLAVKCMLKYLKKD